VTIRALAFPGVAYNGGLNHAAINALTAMSQNRPEADRSGVAAGLAASEKPQDREVAPLIRVQA
jgi:predicted FMN-binding regulatory protein PaiB